MSSWYLTFSLCSQMINLATLHSLSFSLRGIQNHLTPKSSRHISDITDLGWTSVNSERVCLGENRHYHTSWLASNKGAQQAVSFLSVPLVSTCAWSKERNRCTLLRAFSFSCQSGDYFAPSKPAKMSLQSLPAEIKLQIVSLLPAKSIHQFRSTCKTSWALVNGNQRLSTGAGIEASHERIRQCLADHCTFSRTRLGYIKLFLVHAESGMLAFDADAIMDFTLFFAKQSPPHLPTYISKTTLVNFYMWVRPITEGVQEDEVTARWSKEHLLKSLIRYCRSYMLCTRRFSDSIHDIISTAPRIQASGSTFRRRFALTKRCTHGLRAQERYDEHLLLQKILDVPPPPGPAPVSYYVRTQWAQDLIFGLYTGKSIDHVARAAALEQVFVAFHKSDKECGRAQRQLRRVLRRE